MDFPSGGRCFQDPPFNPTSVNVDSIALVSIIVNEFNRVDIVLIQLLKRMEH